MQSTNRKPRITEIKAFAEPAGKPSDEVSSPPLPELIRPASSFKSQVSMEQLDRRPKWLSIGPPAIVVLGLFGALAYFAGLLIAIAALVSLAAFLTICINAAIKYTIDL